MSFDLSALIGDIFVAVDLVPFGIERRRENIASLRISAIEEADGGGFLVEGFDTRSPGSAIRSARIGPHGKGLSIWLLIANAAYALSRANFDEV
jgi:hypothetical protein